MKDDPIYVVSMYDWGNPMKAIKEERLIRGKNKAQVVRHILSLKLATVDDVVRVGSDKIEEAE